MQGLSKLERAVLDKLLAGGHATLTALRQQADSAYLVKRENTGTGFYCDIAVGDQASIAPKDFELGDVEAEIPGLEHGAGFVLFVRDGRLSMLEGFSYEEPWPDQIGAFSLRYSDAARTAELAKLD